MTSHAGSEKFVVLDVRTADEYSTSHVKEAVNMDVLKPSFKDEVSKLDKNKTYKLYCRSGNRSGQAMQIMKTLGFKDVENLGALHQASEKIGRGCEGSGPC